MQTMFFKILYSLDRQKDHIQITPIVSITSTGIFSYFQESRVSIFVSTITILVQIVYSVVIKHCSK